MWNLHADYEACDSTVHPLFQKGRRKKFATLEAGASNGKFKIRYLNIYLEPRERCSKGKNLLITNSGA
jgi:hypothetical protein